MPFFLILDNFQNTYLTFNNFISQPNDNQKLKPIYQNLSQLVGSLNYFIFENSSFVVYFTLDQTGVLFMGQSVDI